MRRWTVMGWIEVDAAACASADANLLGADFSLASQPSATVHGVLDSLALVWCSTGADVGLPVEVMDDDDGNVAAARLLFVTDVDELDSARNGQWESIGAIDIASGRCVACDPFCFSNDPCYRLEFAVRAGHWNAERFRNAGGVLGLRITRDPDAYVRHWP